MSFKESRCCSVNASGSNITLVIPISMGIWPHAEAKGCGGSGERVLQAERESCCSDQLRCTRCAFSGELCVIGATEWRRIKASHAGMQWRSANDDPHHRTKLKLQPTKLHQSTFDAFWRTKSS